MQKPLKVLSLVLLASLNFSMPEQVEGRRKIACDICDASVEPKSPLNFRSFPIQPGLLASLQTKPEMDAQFAQQVQFYSDLFYQSSINYLAGLESVRSHYGLNTPIFSPALPISLATFQKSTAFATTPIWSRKQF